MGEVPRDAICRWISKGKRKNWDDLLRRGAWVNWQNPDGKTALDFAKDEDTVHWLLDHGAYCHSWTRMFGVISRAADRGQTSVIERILPGMFTDHVVAASVRSGCDALLRYMASKMSLKGILGEIPWYPHPQSLVHVAAWNRRAGVIDILCRAGLESDHRNERGKTPLIMAASKPNNGAVIEMLVSHGADVDNTDRYKKTPLWYAAIEGHFENIQTLLGCCAAMPDDLLDTEMPLEMMDYLLRSGATFQTTKSQLAYVERSFRERGSVERKHLETLHPRQIVNAVLASPTKLLLSDWLPSSAVLKRTHKLLRRLVRQTDWKNVLWVMDHSSPPSFPDIVDILYTRELDDPDVHKILERVLPRQRIPKAYVQCKFVHCTCHTKLQSNVCRQRCCRVATTQRECKSSTKFVICQLGSDPRLRESRLTSKPLPWPLTHEQEFL